MFYWPGCAVAIRGTSPTFCEPYFYGNGKYPGIPEMKYFYLLAPIFVVLIKYIDPWVHEIMVSNITGNNQSENDFVIHLNLETKHPTKFNFPIDCCL
jgi:hypothetical protein